VISLRTVAKRIGWRRHFFHGRLWLDRVPDRVLGIETAAPIPHSALGWGPERGNWYEASPWRTLASVLPRSKVSANDVFIDFGCGKGRVLLQAARYPFRKVIGVELSPEVAEVARRNVARVRRHLVCGEIEVVTADVAEFAIPDDLTVAFCFNPATGQVFKQLLANLSESLARHPRDFQLIYHNPEMESALQQEGWREVRRISLHRIDCPCDMTVYRRD
jgi:SAM-dependent methyltransferase